ncbi:MAG: 3-oxoadipate enol-lactonase [Candidatus Acidiferrales bacterium]
MTYTEIGGARFHYRLEGAAGAPVVVLSNSLGTNLSMWDLQIPALARKFRVLRYDSRGHGLSEVTAGPYTIGRLASDVAGLLDALQIPSAHFCGLSVGGLIGQWLGLHFSNRFASLTLSNTAAHIGSLEGWNTRIASIRAGGMASAANAVVSRWFTEEFAKSEPATFEAARQMLLQSPADGYVATCAAIRDTDLREAVSGVKRPTLVISGAQDAATTAVDGRFLSGKISGAQYVELNTAHLSNIEAAEAFTAALLKFLEQQEAK